MPLKVTCNRSLVGALKSVYNCDLLEVFKKFTALLLPPRLVTPYITLTLDSFTRFCVVTL